MQIGDVKSEEKTVDFSVPQGSILGPVLFNVYSSTLSNEVDKHDVDLFGYADDHGVYKSFSPSEDGQEFECLSEVEGCLNNVYDWMCCNRLKMNASKTEYILFGSKPQLTKCKSDSIKVVDDDIQKASVIKSVGVHFDENLSFKTQIKEKCKIAFCNIRAIRSIRDFITVDICKILVSSLVLSHIDYCNSILYGLPNCDLDKLQRVQNCAAKLVLNQSKYSSATAALRELHWLPIRQRIKYKLACMVFRCLHNSAPSYLVDLLQMKLNVRNVRSDTRLCLEVPLLKRSTFLSRAFSYSGPVIWNGLPFSIRSLGDFHSFKKQLKTHFFDEAFG